MIYYKFVNKFYTEIEKISDLTYKMYGTSIPGLLNQFCIWNKRHKIDNDGQYVSIYLSLQPYIEIRL